MSHVWRVRVRGNIPVPFADVAAWWTSAERASELRSRLERRVGPKTSVVWSEGPDEADRWFEARWKIPGRAGEVRWHLVRHEPQAVDGQGSRQLRLRSSLTTEHKSRRGDDVVTDASMETLLLERETRTELRFREEWTTSGASPLRQLLTRRALASVAKAGVSDLMLRCESDVLGDAAGDATAT